MPPMSRQWARRTGSPASDWARGSLPGSPVCPARWNMPPTSSLRHDTPAGDVQYLVADVGEDGAHPASPDTVAQWMAMRSERLVLYGHSHLARLIWLEGAASSPTRQRRPAGPCDDHPHWHVMDARRPHTSYALIDGGEVDLLEVNYDVAAAAAKSRVEGRGEWASPLRTGARGNRRQVD